jgi:DNA-binding SARP family transcriptional activator/tetratricopeptide (TPR) repeat protein
MTARLFLFGSPTVEVGGESVALPFERRNQLLVFLALKRSWVGRAELASMLWPEQESKLAYANLRKILHRLQSLRWASSIESQGAALRFEAETDVFAFESALREQRLADALPMRRGELLAGFDDDQSEAWSSWLNFERDRLRVAWREAALSRLAADIDTAEGIDLSKRLLDADPLDEAALRAHMSWLARSGQSARARQAYHEFVRRLAEDLGLTPGAELRALHDSLGMPIAPVSAPTAAVKFDADFVGRTIELRRIASLLAQDDCRLLCLIGPGGVGKTRLAQQAMHELAPGFSDGAAFVPLEDIESANELGGRIARELEIRLAGRQEPLDQVIEFLRERQMLLVLDNFEQLANDASILERLLQACTGLKILVTSRVRLAVPMEWLLPLEGLPCPEAEDQDRFEAFDAVRLFVQAAQRVEPALVPAVEAASIVDICRQLEGLPLALELAAAWTRVLSCDAIAAELRQGTELLHAVDAAHPARHASIDVVFEQSWRLLSPIERDVLSRLSVFHGGFAAEAARAIAGAPLPVLGALADKSLLRKEGPRIFLHPLVQQLAAARLGDGATYAATQATHAAYFHQLLKQLKSAAAAGDGAALQTIDVEFENCRRAWAWSIAEAQADALRLSSNTLLEYCDHRGRSEDGLALLRAAIESPVAKADGKLDALLLSKASHLEYRLGRYVEAEAMALRALEATRKSRDRATKLQSLNVLGTCALQLGRWDDARRYFKQALEAAAPEGQANALAGTLDHLALVEKHIGNYAEALRLSLQSLVQYQRLRDSAEEALCLNNLGSLCLTMREDDAAGVHLQQGLAICERDGIVGTRGYIHSNLTELALRAGDLAAAESHASHAIEVATKSGNRAVLSWVKTKVARLAVRRGDNDAARSALAEGLGIALELRSPSLKLNAVESFAELLSAQGEVSCARRVLAYAADHPTASAPVRDDIRARLDKLPASEHAEPPWPKLELDDLLHRIVVESNIAHAPLIATLRGERVRVTH